MSARMESQDGTGGLTGRVVSLAAMPDLAGMWRSLERESDCTFFQSWHWMGTWMQTAADRENLRVFECRRGDALLGLGVLGAGRVRRRAIISSRQLVLSESAADARNMLVEYNELLCRRGEEQAVTRAFMDTLARLDDWEEIRVAYGRREVWAPHYAAHAGLRAVVDSTASSWIAPLTKETTVESLLAGLSSNRRSQLRRSFREFEKTGPLSVSAAASAGEAIAYFRELGNLHTQRWQEKGQPGIFARRAWVQFHEALIRNSFDAGGVQLLRIRCGSTEDIGYIYNLLWQGGVLMLQTGFVRDGSNVRRAGYVSHLLAMQLNASLGMTAYDFLPGDDDYKRVLAGPGQVCESVRFQRNRLKFLLESAAVKAVRTVQRHVRRRRRPRAPPQGVNPAGGGSP